MSEKGAFTHRLRVLLVEALVGLILGVFFWELFGQRFLAMKYGSLGSSLTCAPDVVRALAEFDSGLRLSAAVGAGSSIVLMFAYRVWRWRERKKLANPAPIPVVKGPPKEP